MRAAVLEKRKALSVSAMRAAETTLQHQLVDALQQLYQQAPDIKTSPNIKNPGHCLQIGGYLAVRGEMGLGSSLRWLRQQGHSTCLPIVCDQMLVFASVDDDTHYKKGKFNIDIPVVDTRQHVEPLELDMVLVPLVSFDLEGNRLGMGGGFYDRTFSYRLPAADTTVGAYKPAKSLAAESLAAKRGAANASSSAKTQFFIGIAYEFQRVDSVPAESWDVPLDMVITEKNVYHCVITH